VPVGLSKGGMHVFPVHAVMVCCWKTTGRAPLRAFTTAHSIDSNLTDERRWLLRTDPLLHQLEHEPLFLVQSPHKPAQLRSSRISTVICRRRSITSTDRRPCRHMPLPLPRGAPVDRPPCAVPALAWPPSTSCSFRLCHDELHANDVRAAANTTG
jgi:hypothetical protein